MLAIQLLILLALLNRYVFGFYLYAVRRTRVQDRDDALEPTVTVVIPLYNEGRSIYDTIHSVARVDYPTHKLAIIVVDDCSTDDSYAWAARAAEELPNVAVIKNAVNMGKRRGINHAVRMARSEMVLSVDSDVIVHPGAVRELVAHFTRPDIAAVGGRVHVSNPNDNWLSKLQTIKYYFGQEHLKHLERALESVMCLSGCLTMYRRHVLLELEPVLETRNLLGVPIKYGEDRFLTHQIVRAGYRTRMALDAMCFTKAPTTLTGYFNQQLRWKRSNLADFIVGLADAWRLHPIVCVHYLSLAALLVAYPIVVVSQVLDGELLSVMALHVQVIAVLGCIYALAPSTRRLPAFLRVHPLAFLPMAVLMPVAYLVLTPLGALTLDTGSWETRGHVPGVPQ